MPARIFDNDNDNLLLEDASDSDSEGGESVDDYFSVDDEWEDVADNEVYGE